MEKSLAVRKLLSSPTSGNDPRSGGTPQDEAAVQAAMKLWIVLARAHASVVAREQRDLIRYRLTRAEFGLLDALYFKGPLLLGDVQRALLVSSGGITYLIDRLEKRGFVQRRPSLDDRRAIYAALTAEGESFFREIFAEHVRGLAVTVSGLTLEEQAEATRLLKKLGTSAVRLTESATEARRSPATVNPGARAAQRRLVKTPPEIKE